MTTPGSNRQRSYRTHAVVLRRRDHGDADRIVTVYTPGLGKQSFIAKGIRKPTSRKAGHLELFAHTQLQLAQARTWDIVTEVATVESFRRLREDLECIGYASYVCELIDCFGEEDDENLPLWELMLLALRELDQLGGVGDKQAALVLVRWFELQLLSVTGFQPQLFTCLDCDRELEPVVNYLLLTDGGVICPTCRARRSEAEEIDPNVLKILRYLQSRPWREVSQLTVRPAIMRTAQNILHRYLLGILEHQLKSTDFLRRLQHTNP